MSYQIAGLHVLNQSEKRPVTDNNTQISQLLEQLVTDICQGVAGKEKVLKLFSAKLSETHITTLLAWIKENLNNAYYTKRYQVRVVLIALLPNLNETHVSPILTWIISNLNHKHFAMRERAQQTLTALAPALKKGHITTLLTSMQGSLSLADSSPSDHAHQALTSLAPKLNEAAIPPLLG